MDVILKSLSILAINQDSMRILDYASCLSLCTKWFEVKAYLNDFFCICQLFEKEKLTNEIFPEA